MQITVDPAFWFLSSENTQRSPAFTTGNTVTALVDGAAYFRDLKTALAACNDTLLMSGWRFSEEQLLDPKLVGDKPEGETFGSAVRAVAKRGADVKALLWSAASVGAALPDFLKPMHAEDNVRFCRLVNEAGGDAVLDSRLSNVPGSSHHQKFIVALSRDPSLSTAYVGGIDVCLDRWDTPAHDSAPERQGDIIRIGALPGHLAGFVAWHDVQAKLQGPAVAQVWQMFRARWNDRRPPNSLPQLAEFEGKTRIESAAPELPAVGTCAVQVNQTLPAGMFPEIGGPGEVSIEAAHLHAIERAQHYIYIEDQYFWPCALVEPLAAALQRGVRVVFVVARDGRTPPQSLAERMRRDVVMRLRATGGDRFEIFHVERPDGNQIYVHSKVTIIDDCWAAIGSANFNGRSLTNDTELEVAVVDADLVDSRMDGLAVKVCRFAQELRRTLWAEHFELSAADLADPIASLARIVANPGKRAKRHVVQNDRLDMDSIVAYLKALIAGSGDVKSAAMVPPSYGPSLSTFVEEIMNPRVAPLLTKLEHPFVEAWRKFWVARAEWSIKMAGRHTAVTQSDIAGQTFLESRNGVAIFRLSDGRYHVVSHFAVPTLAAARAAASIVSVDVDGTER